MTTGLHTVRDVMCAKCGETLGWKYGPSYFPQQVCTPACGGLLTVVRGPQIEPTKRPRSTRRASTFSSEPCGVRTWVLAATPASWH